MMKAVVSQWIGKRAVQEDSYRVRFFPEGVLVIVCDGMGGHQLGALAADSAASSFEEAFGKSSRPMMERLNHALAAANNAVGRLLQEQSLFGGTTLVAAYIGSGVVRWISVGDSALMLWRHGRLVRLNADHSLRPLLRSVVPSATVASNMLRSALTGEPPELVDASPTPVPLLPDDRLIVCTDGADVVLNPARVSDDVSSVLNNRSGNVSSALLELVCRGASPDADNATILVVDV